MWLREHGKLPVVPMTSLRDNSGLTPDPQSPQSTAASGTQHTVGVWNL